MLWEPEGLTPNIVIAIDGAIALATNFSENSKQIISGFSKVDGKLKNENRPLLQSACGKTIQIYEKSNGYKGIWGKSYEKTFSPYHTDTAGSPKVTRTIFKIPSKSLIGHVYEF